MAEQEQVKGFEEHFAGFKRHLKLAAATFTVIMTFGVGFSMSLPDIYRATGFLLIEAPEIPAEIIRSTVTTYTTRQLTTLNEKILTISNLIRIIEEYDLYEDERRNAPVEMLAITMRSNISIEIQSRDSVSSSGMPQPYVVGFTIAFEYEHPEATKLVVDELVTMYLEENIKARSEQTAETADFLEGEIEQLEQEIARLEGNLADFKVENAERLPSLGTLNLNMMNRVDQELMAIERSLTAIDGNRISIKAQMATVDPSIPVRLPDGTYALSPTDQLKALQTQLSIYDSRYSDDHPDVIATRRDIASIKQRFGIDANLTQMDEAITTARTELAIAQEKYTEEHPDVIQLNNTLVMLVKERAETEQRQLDAQVAPDNPAYIQLEMALATLENQEIALKSEEAELQLRLTDYERRLMETPQIEKELAALSRTLSSTSNRYWVLRDKQFAAQMGETLETQQKGERMILLEPPRVPLSPYKPNRGAIITLAFLFALVAGVGITQLADGLDKSIRDSAGIMSVQGVPPLVEIPYIYIQDELAQALKLRKMAIASLPALMLIGIVIVHFTLQPLDVLFYAVAARLGL